LIFAATFIPSWEALMAPTYPPGPDPMTTRSTSWVLTEYQRNTATFAALCVFLDNNWKKENGYLDYNLSFKLVMAWLLNFLLVVLETLQDANSNGVMSWVTGYLKLPVYLSRQLTYFVLKQSFEFEVRLLTETIFRLLIGSIS
jgi:hypothetical protein